VIAVNMPNDNNLYNTTVTGKNAWKNYIVSISQLEQAAAAEGLTLDFLSSVNATVKAYLKNKKFQ
jgi:endonuclease G, mitochondrial